MIVRCALEGMQFLNCNIYYEGKLLNLSKTKSCEITSKVKN